MCFTLLNVHFPLVKINISLLILSLLSPNDQK
jgi:hypothetical protein